MERITAIARRHGSKAGRPLKLDNLDMNDWSRFTNDLKAATLPQDRLLDDQDYVWFLRDMFVEIHDFLEHAYGGDPSEQIYYLLDSFGWGGQPFATLLPERAKPMLWKTRNIAEARADEQRLRDDQMGY